MSHNLPTDSSPDDLRAEGWMVAAHNDYRLRGEFFTFWLMTKGSRAAKGEGNTDAEALNQIRKLARESDGLVEHLRRQIAIYQNEPQREFLDKNRGPKQCLEPLLDWAARPSLDNGDMGMSEYRGKPGESEDQKRERLLRNWSAISKALNLTKRDPAVADYDDELASIIVLTATETRALFENPQ